MRRLFTAVASALALVACTATGAEDAPAAQRRFPTSADYGPDVMQRFSFQAGGDFGWRLSGLRTPRPEAPLRVVVVSGTPSWSEYWAPVLAAAPQTWEVIVVDRPGFAQSEPREAVPRIADQALSLSPLLEVGADRRVVLVGQSFGGPIAAWMAAAAPAEARPVGLVLLSAFFGERGRTADRLMALGGVAQPLLPRDLRNAVSEVRGQSSQLSSINAALQALDLPILVVHGGVDSFVPVSAGEALAAKLGARAEWRLIPDGDHFLNACCVPDVLAAIAAVAGPETGAPIARISPSTHPIASRPHLR